MSGAPGIVLCSGWSTGPAAWDGVLGCLPPLPVAHLDWWRGLADPAEALKAAAAQANAKAGRDPEAAVIVAGWSLGGQIALQAALDAPEAISDLILIATPVRLLADETGLGTDAAALRAMRQGLRRNADAIVTAFWGEALAGDRTGYDHDGVFGILAEVDAKTLDLGLAALEKTDLRRRLPQIETPAVVIQGDDDRIVGVHAVV